MKVDVSQGHEITPCIGLANIDDGDDRWFDGGRGRRRRAIIDFNIHVHKGQH